MIYNGYTKSEICMLYREAKNKKLQIEILTQLTGLRTFEVESILEEGGYLEQMTDLMKDRILDLHGQGLNDSAIGRELGVAQSQVSTFLRKKGLPPNGRRKSTKKEEEQKMIKVISDDTRELIKDAVPHASSLEKLKEETKKNVEELKEVLPKSIPDPDDLPIDYIPVETDIAETLTPQQYYELAKITLQLLKVIWEG